MEIFHPDSLFYDCSQRYLPDILDTGKSTCFFGQGEAFHEGQIIRSTQSNHFPEATGVKA